MAYDLGRVRDYYNGSMEEYDAQNYYETFEPDLNLEKEIKLIQKRGKHKQNIQRKRVYHLYPSTWQIFIQN